MPGFCDIQDHPYKVPAFANDSDSQDISFPDALSYLPSDIGDYCTEHLIEHHSIKATVNKYMFYNQSFPDGYE
jgi:hypothetical protein